MEQPRREGFGTLLRRHRRERGWTQAELAERAQLSVEAISALERGTRRAPWPDTVNRLCNALDLAPDDQSAFATAAHSERAGSMQALPTASPAQAVGKSVASGGHVEGASAERVSTAPAVRTFLIADVRGYTRFTVEHGDEATARLADRFADITEEVVARRSGQVIELRGDSALVAFPLTREAFRAAIELQDRFRREREIDSSLPLTVGIGIDAGEAVPVKGGYRGKALNLAARLQTLAQTGEVLTSEGAAHLAGTIDGLTYARRGLVELKGFADPVSVIEVVSLDRKEDWVSSDSAQGRAPLPLGGFLGALPQSPLVARDDELERAQALVERVIKGQGQCILLTGERGAGKTRLAQEIMLNALNHRFLVAAGRCYEDEQGTPFGPVRDLLGGAVGHAPQTLRLDLLRRLPALARLLPLGSTDVSPAHGEIDPRHVAEAITAFGQALGGDMPVAIMVDDLQWADADSLQIFQYLIRHTRSDRIIILGTYRDTNLEDHQALFKLIRDLNREHVVERIPVRRFSAEGTAAMVAATVGDMEASDEFVEFVHRRTHGNPFYITHILQTLGGHYRLVREIGAGGMGRVFEAVDIRSGERVAAKLMLARSEADTHALQRFEQEGQVLETLRHPNIVEVKGTFLDEHASCIIMELLEGRSLGQVLAEEELSLGRIQHLAIQVADALACAHQHQVAHRDIKPDNIMVLDEDRVKVTDFGIARMLRPEMTMHTMMTTGMTLGTPYYMAPEQIEGKKVDGRADIYSLGAVLYQLTTGQVPFSGDDPLAIAVQHLRDAPRSPRQVNPGLSKDWEAVILKALAKDPGERFRSAELLRAALEELPVDGRSRTDAGSEIAEAQTPGPRRALLRAVTPVPPRNRHGSVDGRAAPALVSPQGGDVAITSKGERWIGLLPARWAALPALAGIVLLAIVAVAWKVRQGGQSSPPGSRPVAIWGDRAHLGAFRIPTGVAAGRNGTIYVADQLTNRIQVLAPDGTPLASWAAHLSGPAGTATDSHGALFVADQGHAQVRKLGPDGKSDDSWKAGVTFQSPYGVAVGRHDDLFVADAGCPCVYRLAANGTLLATWGPRDTGKGRLNHPDAVTTDRAGDVYIVDAGSNRIQKRSPVGKLLEAWTLHGVLTGISIDARGQIYVVDQGSHRVQVLSPAGVHITSLGAGTLRQPNSVVVAGDRVYVTDGSTRGVEVFSATGKRTASWTQTGVEGIRLESPVGLAVGASGSTYVADKGREHVYKLTPQGRADPRWKPGGARILGQVSGVAVGRDAVYVTDQIAGTVLRLSGTGALPARWRRVELQDLSGVAVAPDGTAYVSSHGLDHVVHLSRTGKILGTWGSPGVHLGPFLGPSGITVDGDGNVCVTDDQNNTVQKWSASGAPLRIWGERTGVHLSHPRGVAVDAVGRIYIADQGNNRVVMLSPDGGVERTWGAAGGAPGQFRAPEGVALDAEGSLYVSDTGNHRIQVFRGQ